VVCAVRTGAGGVGVFIWGAGEVLGTRAGNGKIPFRPNRIAERYTGLEWLVPGRKFVRSRLDELLERLRTAAPAEAREDMHALLHASRRVNDDLPLVKKPEIVAAFADRLLKAERRPRGGDAEDEEPEPRVIRVSELFDPFEFSLLTLLELVPPEQLGPHGEALGALSVHARRDRRVVELLVKAGSAKALAGLAADPERLPRAGREGLLLAVRAASGDEKAYTALLERFAAAKGEIEKADLARLLAVTGREQGLKAVAGQLRDTRTYERHATRSVRGEIADALRLVYPEERALYVAWLPTAAEMAKVEEFCSVRLGVKFEGEVPGKPAGNIVDMSKMLEMPGLPRKEVLKGGIDEHK
jgi:hypothetical protein